MKNLLVCLLMAMIGASATAQTDQKEYKTFVKNDHHVYYCTHNGVTVVVDPTVDGLFEPHITIINESGHEFLFEPKKITAQAYGIPGNTYKSTRYRVERLLEKGDTLGFEKDVLTIYTPEKYQKKASRTLWWAGLRTSTSSSIIRNITKIRSFCPNRLVDSGECCTFAVRI